MARILGIDLGDKRVGVALSDPTGIIAMPHSVIPHTGANQVILAVVDLCREQSVGKVVVGLPLNMDGSSGPAAQKAQAFAAKLRERLAIPVEVWDERLSTRTAEQALIEGGTRRERRKALVDKVAAQVILQHYLDAHPGAEDPSDTP
ncbi:MAG: Holliday junction resolvase RuvX [Kiritimatiellae bacterium]|nr:Holliday junction resolvase RuvX [Kiritimatiellia bacterium]